ncbi:MAG: antibiotic biosynthesis monooxygenase [Kiloniellaceae bacterium]|nr:antibiotic biosynthesis monooxygenase [Kiloniellaceae bacterium]
MKKVTNLAFIRAQAGRSAELGERLRRLAARSRREPGCRSYDLHRADDDADLWMLYETWHSAADRQAHYASAHLRAFIAEAPFLVEGPLDLRGFTPSLPLDRVRGRRLLSGLAARH